MTPPTPATDMLVFAMAQLRLRMDAGALTPPAYVLEVYHLLSYADLAPVVAERTMLRQPPTPPPTEENPT